MGTIKEVAKINWRGNAKMVRTDAKIEFLFYNKNSRQSDPGFQKNK